LWIYITLKFECHFTFWFDRILGLPTAKDLEVFLTPQDQTKHGLSVDIQLQSFFRIWFSPIEIEQIFQEPLHVREFHSQTSGLSLSSDLSFLTLFLRRSKRWEIRSWKSKRYRDHERKWRIKVERQRMSERAIEKRENEGQERNPSQDKRQQ